MGEWVLTENKSAWLRCKIDSGMFSDECAVTYPATDNWRKSVFVPSSCVRNNGLVGSGDVLVRIIIKDKRTFAVLPSSLQDIVSVDDNDLHAE